MIIYNQPFKNHKQLTCWVYYNEYDWIYSNNKQWNMWFFFFFFVVIGDTTILKACVIKFYNIPNIT